MANLGFNFQPQSLEHFLNEKNKEQYKNGYYEVKDSIVFQNSYYIDFIHPLMHNLAKKIGNFLISNNFLFFDPRYFRFSHEKQKSFPLRGINCLHIDTVDIERFMHFNKIRNDFFYEGRPCSNWICPICKISMPLESIRVSTRVMKIIDDCEKDNVENYFIVYNKKNLKFNYFAIDDSPKSIELNLIINGIKANFEYLPQKTRIEALPKNNYNSEFEEDPIGKREIESSRICHMNYFGSDNLTKFFITFDNPGKDNGNFKVYFPIFIPLPKKKRIKVFEKIQNDLNIDISIAVDLKGKPLNAENTNSRRKEAVFLFPGIFEEDFRYLNIASLLFQMSSKDANLAQRITFLDLSKLIKVKPEIIKDYCTKISKTPNSRIIDLPKFLTLVSRDFDQFTPNNLVELVNNYFIKNKCFISLYKMESKFLQQDNNEENESFSFNQNTLVNEDLKDPSISECQDNIIVTFYQNLMENNLDLLADKKYFLQINTPRKHEMESKIYSYNYQLVLSLDIVKNFINPSLTESNKNAVIIVLSNRKILFNDIVVIQPPHISTSSLEYNDSLMIEFIYGLYFFLCDAIVIDLINGIKEEEEKLFEKLINFRYNFPGLISKALLILSSKDDEIEEMLKALGIDSQNDRIDAKYNLVDYYVVQNVYVPKKQSNFKGFSSVEEYYTLLKMHTPFQGRRFSSNNAKSIANNIEFRLKEFSKYEISVQALNTSLDSYSFSIKGQLLI